MRDETTSKDYTV